MSRKDEDRLKKGDFVVIALVVVLAFMWAVISHEGSVAAIYVDGELYKKLPLNIDTQLIVESEFGTNTVVIEKGGAKIVDADCDNKQCETEVISETAHSLVCLPNRLSVIIEDEKNSNETDVII